MSDSRQVDLLDYLAAHPSPPRVESPTPLLAHPLWPSLLPYVVVQRTARHTRLELRGLCEARHQQGIKTHGGPLTTHNGRDAATDALQEALDGMAYSHQGELECSDEEHGEDSDEYWATQSRRDRFISIAESAVISIRNAKRKGGAP